MNFEERDQKKLFSDNLTVQNWEWTLNGPKRHHDMVSKRQQMYAHERWDKVPTWLTDSLYGPRELNNTWELRYI